jgi:phosphatidylinositol alpha-1,6-mannosyltransferase
MKEWLRAADVFASPCRSRWAGLEVEGFGIVFAEAALAGLPVIAGDSGGAPEAVIQGETGLVVDGHSVQQVAAGLAAILRRTSEQRREMGARGRELALARHTPAVVGERYRQLLRRAAGK